MNRSEIGAPARPGARAATNWLSPRLFVYVLGPVALAVLLPLRRFGLVADEPVWVYALAIIVPQIASLAFEQLARIAPGTALLRAQIVLHVATVTVVIYVCGWGPALGMAYAFSAFAELQKSGARVWRAVLGWSLLGCAVGQALVFQGWMPSFLSAAGAQTIGFLGAIVFGIAIRMAGTVGENKELADAQLAEQTLDASRARDEAQRSEAHYRAVVENAAEGILTIAGAGTIASFNAAAEAIFGWTEKEIVGRPATVILPADMEDPLNSYLATALSADHGPIRRGDIESIGQRRDGTLFPMMVAISTITSDGAPPTLSGIVRDMSDQKRVEAELADQGLHDALTRLPNRTMLVDRLDQALARTRRSGRTFVTLFVDLDRFKSVNDRLGHSIGDQLLVEAARRIKSCVRESDTVARLGGDEFVVLCEDIHGVHQATVCADRIIAALCEPFRFGDDDAHVSASIGIALCSDGAQKAETVLTNADVAMYRAKDSGRNCYKLFDDAMQQWIAAENALERDLRRAVIRNELRLFCQPFIAADTGEIRGFEALVRWERPGVGLVAPDDFIPAAEETGLIVDIGAWVLEEACLYAARWDRRWPDRRLGIAVNLSTRQLLSGDIVDVVTGALERTGLDPTLLTLELTESTLIDDAVGAEALLRELRELGLHLALDDFGTGYSSLTYLRAFPIDIVKIDRSFVSAIGVKRDDTAIVAAVLALAQNLRMSVVAEGVETVEQLAVLQHLGCPYMQGYLFSRPIPIRDAEDLVLSASCREVYTPVAADGA